MGFVSPPPVTLTIAELQNSTTELAHLSAVAYLSAAALATLLAVTHAVFSCVRCADCRIWATPVS